MHVPITTDGTIDPTQRSLSEYGFGLSNGADNIHVICDLGGDPCQSPSTFRYVEAEWLGLWP